MNDNPTPATPVDLVGQGPFELPICADADLRLGDKLAVIDLTTLEGHLVQVPITLAALAGLHEVIGRALGRVQLRRDICGCERDRLIAAT